MDVDLVFAIVGFGGALIIVIVVIILLRNKKCRRQGKKSISVADSWGLGEQEWRERIKATVEQMPEASLSESEHNKNDIVLHLNHKPNKPYPKVKNAIFITYPLQDVMVNGKVIPQILLY
jgi:hypothetical protein